MQKQIKEFNRCNIFMTAYLTDLYPPTILLLRLSAPALKPQVSVPTTAISASGSGR